MEDNSPQDQPPSCPAAAPNYAAAAAATIAEKEILIRAHSTDEHILARIAIALGKHIPKNLRRGSLTITTRDETTTTICWLFDAKLSPNFANAARKCQVIVEIN